MFVDRFGRSSRFFHLEFVEKAISEGFMAHSRAFRGFSILSDSIERSFYGPLLDLILIKRLPITPFMNGHLNTEEFEYLPNGDLKALKIFNLNLTKKLSFMEA